MLFVPGVACLTPTGFSLTGIFFNWAMIKQQSKSGEQNDTKGDKCVLLSLLKTDDICFIKNK